MQPPQRRCTRETLAGLQHKEESFPCPVPSPFYPPPSPKVWGEPKFSLSEGGCPQLHPSEQKELQASPALGLTLVPQHLTLVSGLEGPVRVVSCVTSNPSSASHWSMTAKPFPRPWDKVIPSEQLTGLRCLSAHVSLQFRAVRRAG